MTYRELEQVIGMRNLIRSWDYTPDKAMLLESILDDILEFIDERTVVVRVEEITRAS